jgi:hypothetical protein
MSSIAFSGALSNMQGTAQIASTSKTAPAQAASTATTSQASGNLKDDTVKLSVAAQAKMMHRQGLSASVIASSLGTNVASIDGYLNIKVAAQAAATTATSNTATASTSTPAPAVATEAASTETASSSTKVAVASTARVAAATDAAI